MLKSEASERLENLIKAKEVLENNLSDAPQGKIRFVRNRNRLQFYLRNAASESTGTYIAKSKERIIKVYMQKAYNEKALRLVKKEISALERFIDRYAENDEEIKYLYSSLPDEAKRYIDPIDISDDDYALMWQNQPFKAKEIRDIQTRYLTDRGEQVRSKSELNIANTLNKYGIPYKYECPLEIRKGLYFYPDFTVLNVRKRKVYYWEHRGMMEDREYAKHAVSRIKEYEKNGIMLGRDLIISEESSSIPLGSDDIVRLIKTHLLD